MTDDKNFPAAPLRAIVSVRSRMATTCGKAGPKRCNGNRAMGTSQAVAPNPDVTARRDGTEFRPRFSPAGLDSLIDVVVKKTVASIRAREAAQRRAAAQSD